MNINCELASDMSILHVVLAYRTAKKTVEKTMLLNFDARVVSENQKELLQCSWQAIQLQDILDYIDYGLGTIQSVWKDARSQWISKLQQLQQAMAGNISF